MRGVLAFMIVAVIGVGLYTVYVSPQERTAATPVSQQIDTRAERIRVARDRIREKFPVAKSLPSRPDLAAIRDAVRLTEAADKERQSPIDRLRAAGQTPPPGVRSIDLKSLPSIRPKEVNLVLIPVLIPDHPDVREKIRVYGQPNAYSASAPLDNAASLSISGTCTRFIGGDPRNTALRKRLSAKPPRLPGTQTPYYISRNDFGADLSFSKFACGYVVTIECGDPDSDPRCAEDDFLISLADSLILANPAFGERAQ